MHLHGVDVLVTGLQTISRVPWIRVLGLSPQTDGQAERVNQVLEQYLRCFVNEQQDDWAQWSATAEFSYNNALHESTGVTPFYETCGRALAELGFCPFRVTAIYADTSCRLALDPETASTRCSILLN